MKTIKEIKVDRQSVIKRIETEKLKPRELTNLKGQRDFLNSCILYLESSPKEELLLIQVQEIERGLEIIAGRHTPNDNLLKKDETKRRKEHEKLYDVPRTKSHLKTLKYLLS